MDSVSKLAERMGGIREYIVNALGSRGTISRCGWLVAIVACMVVAVGCATDKRSAELIAYAEEIAMELPDSALRVVQSIDPKSVRGKHDRAHYKLVVAEAHYYNRLAVDRDTIAQPLFDYYIESDNHAERARALYQHAIVMQAEGENARAMYSLLEAEKSLTHLDNPRLSGLVHRTMGEIYGSECLFQNALEEYQKSKEHFDKAELSFHSAYALYNIAKAYNRLRDFDKAIESLLATEQNYIKLNHPSRVYDAQIELCFNYILKNDFDSCFQTFSRIDKNANICYSYCSYYCIDAILSAKNGKYNEAEELIKKAKKEQGINMMQISYAECTIMIMQNKYEKALDAYTLMIAEQDKSVYNIVNNSLLQRQVELLESEYILIEMQARSNKIILTSIIITLLLTVIAILLYMRYRSVKQSRDIANYIAIIAELKQSVKSINTPKQQNDEFIELDKLFDIYYQYGDTIHTSNKIAKAVGSSIESIKNDIDRLHSFENIINQRYQNILNEIKGSCPKLNNKEYRYIIYHLLGFSTRSIAVLLDIDTDALARLKYRVKIKLKESGKDNITNILSKGKPNSLINN